MPAMNNAKLIRWEMVCIAAEASVAAVALWLMLGVGLAELGSGILFALVAISLVVRGQHYLAINTQKTPPLSSN
jgi:hypothetical protein